jgi:hypothetical protein
MKYIKVEWPEIQDYMDNPEYPEECFFDPKKNVWFIPEWWEAEKELEDEFSGGGMRDLEDAIG